MPRSQKKSKRFVKQSQPVRASFLTISLISIGIILIAISLSWQFYKARTLSFAATSFQETVIPVSTAIPHQLTIPDLTISLSISPAEIENEVWEVSETGASYLATSAVPGTPGNIIMYGHNKTNLLGNLKKAKLGQTIYVTATDGSVHNYTIQEIKTVNPDQTEVIQPTNTEVLTLYTCTGFLDSKRLVIKAIPQAN
jgi:LPXTG-site transpeptidase (sortase) family protein